MIRDELRGQYGCDESFAIVKATFVVAAKRRAILMAACICAWTVSRRVRMRRVWRIVVVIVVAVIVVKEMLRRLLCSAIVRLAVCRSICVCFLLRIVFRTSESIRIVLLWRGEYFFLVAQILVLLRNNTRIEREIRCGLHRLHCL